jgi:hypothetical protein
MALMTMRIEKYLCVPTKRIRELTENHINYDTSLSSVERYEDMSPTGKLILHKQEDGDICISILDEKGNFAGVEFCSIGAGGGKSIHTRKALLYLFNAMEKDNKDNPIYRI